MSPIGDEITHQDLLGSAVFRVPVRAPLAKVRRPRAPAPSAPASSVLGSRASLLRPSRYFCRSASNSSPLRALAHAVHPSIAVWPATALAALDGVLNSCPSLNRMRPSFVTRVRRSRRSVGGRKPACRQPREALPGQDRALARAGLSASRMFREPSVDIHTPQTVILSHFKPLSYQRNWLTESLFPTHVTSLRAR